MPPPPAVLAADGPAEASRTPSPRPVAADDARIAYMGRIELSGQKAQMGYPGITIRFVFRGPAPTLKLTGDSPNPHRNHLSTTCPPQLAALLLSCCGALMAPPPAVLAADGPAEASRTPRSEE